MIKLRNIVLLLDEAAEQAREDVLNGYNVDLSNILDNSTSLNELKLISQDQIDECAKIVDKLTLTKDGTRRLVAALTVAIKHLGDIAL